MGYIAGNKKLAMIASLILTLVINPIFTTYLLMNVFVIGFHPGFQFVGLIQWYMVLPLLLPEAIALAYLGSYWREIRRLNPLRETQLKILLRMKMIQLPEIKHIRFKGVLIL